VAGAKLVAAMAVYVLVGFPLVWYLWETVNELLKAQVEGRQLLLAVPVLLLLLGLLILLGRSVQRWDRTLGD
jgi:hypothetical protein